jgi:RimJ/RimL family protein N-acetyltransferase
MEYLFTSQRLGFRNGHDADIPMMAEMNADPVVMEFFPGLLDDQQTEAFVRRIQKQFDQKGYCYFAVDKRDHQEWIGCIGLTDQVFNAQFIPYVDIGWGLKRNAWTNGFAAEGAKKCLEYGWKDFGLEKIYAIAPKINIRSEHIMKKVGMEKVLEFDHPSLSMDTRLNPFILYMKEG